jgi:hypothetical protein
MQLDLMPEKKKDIHAVHASQANWDGRILGGQRLGMRGGCPNRIHEDIGLARHASHERPRDCLPILFSEITRKKLRK